MAHDVHIHGSNDKLIWSIQKFFAIYYSSIINKNRYLKNIVLENKIRIIYGKIFKILKFYSRN